MTGLTWTIGISETLNSNPLNPVVRKNPIQRFSLRSTWRGMETSYGSVSEGTPRGNGEQRIDRTYGHGAIPRPYHLRWHLSLAVDIGRVPFVVKTAQEAVNQRLL